MGICGSLFTRDNRARLLCGQLRVAAGGTLGRGELSGRRLACPCTAASTAPGPDGCTGPASSACFSFAWSAAAAAGLPRPSSSHLGDFQIHRALSQLGRSFSWPSVSLFVLLCCCALGNVLEMRLKGGYP